MARRWFSTTVRRSERQRRCRYKSREAITHVNIGRNRSTDPLVEGTHEGSMARLVGRLGRLDARCVRLHHLPTDHGADITGVWRPTDGRRRRVHRYAVDAPGWSDGVGLA